jgi:energy-coupling factor transporter ATP-binding protein EcfA2
MNNFLFCNYVIKSNISLPELMVSKNIEADFFFQCRQDDTVLFSGNWGYHWYVDNVLSISLGIHDSYFWLQFPELADFRISPNAQEIHCFPLSDIPEHTLRHLLLDQVLPRCMAHQGDLLLHASAVQTPHGLVLFTGPSGAGKSTLAGYFHQSGHSAISDDCMLLEEEQDYIKAIPSYGGVRLWQDSQEFLFPEAQGTSEMAHYSSKQRVPLSENKTNEVENNKIAAIIFLSPYAQDEEDKKVVLKPTSMREGYMELLKQTYQLDVTDPQKIAQHAQVLGRVIPKIPLFQLSMPHEYDLLPTAKQLILETVLAKSGNTPT